MYARTTWPPPGGTTRTSGGPRRAGHGRESFAVPRPARGAGRGTAGPDPRGTELAARPPERTRDTSGWGR
ncbi:hypothetical protein GCM10010275_39740 [Streptomyces litmocidini]|nr:hypothetical protein GCM10010275_39740 [Streptomyces litmocidini]